MITRAKLVEQLREHQIRSAQSYSAALAVFSPNPHIASRPQTLLQPLWPSPAAVGNPSSARGPSAPPPAPPPWEWPGGCAGSQEGGGRAPQLAGSMPPPPPFPSASSRARCSVPPESPPPPLARPLPVGFRLLLDFVGTSFPLHPSGPDPWRPPAPPCGADPGGGEIYPASRPCRPFRRARLLTDFVSTSFLPFASDP
ncbi:hypothetical protein ZWY2020_025900 [Hordeum vulgare]|nr:hypothetical protein ZWY2020_025900 [Hordeum vulgare]